MPVAAAKAFILGNEPFKEQDKLVYLLTESQGILKAIAPGALKHKNRFGAILELFTEGEFIYYWIEDHEFVTLSKGDLTASHFNMVSQPGNIFYFYFIAEILLRFVPYHHRDDRIFRLVRSLLESREAGMDIRLLLVYFMIWILRLEGVMFNPRLCSNCLEKDIAFAWLRADFRGLLCSNCHNAEKWRLEDLDLQFLSWTQNHAPGQLALWLPKLDCGKLTRLFRQKIEYHGELQLQTARYLPEFL